MTTTPTSASGIREIYPYLRVRGAERALDFYSRAFGARELMRLTEPGGRIGHAEITIGNTTLMLADEYPECGIVGPQTIGGTTFCMHLHVDDLDKVLKSALAAGATIVRDVTDQFWGERTCTILDPFGHEWYLGQHIEDVSPEEMQRRYTALLSKSDGDR